MSEALTKAKLERYERLEQLGPPPPQRFNRKLRKWLEAYASIWCVRLDEATMMLREMYSLEAVHQMANQTHPMLSRMRRADSGVVLVEPIEGT